MPVVAKRASAESIQVTKVEPAVICGPGRAWRINRYHLATSNDSRSERAKLGATGARETCVTSCMSQVEFISLALLSELVPISTRASEFTAAPCGAIETLLAKTGWNKDDVDLWEINEAFAMVAMMPIDAFGLDAEKVNIYGGACAQGHPVGSTGSRLIVTLMNALKNTGGKKGIAALCIGGGEAVAVAIEMI